MWHLFLFFVIGLGVVAWSVSASTTIDSSAPSPASLPVSCAFGAVAPLTVPARSWQITDLTTGAVLASYNADESLPFASVVKLITARAVEQQSDIHTTKVRITSADVATEGRAGNLQAGQVYKAHELLFPLLLTSSNDAGVALDRTYHDLVADMQQFVEYTGAHTTLIADTTGLSHRNRTTAGDLSKIIRTLYYESPHLFDITRTKQVISQYENGWVNTIPFRTLPGYVGGKHGYTPEAGQTGVAVFTSAHAVPMQVGIVILDSPHVARTMEQLLHAVTEAYSCTDAVTDVL